MAIGVRRPRVRCRLTKMPASQPACSSKVCTYLACASSLRGVKSKRSCGCNQFPVGLAVKPTWAAHAGQIYYYAARERRRRTRARATAERAGTGGKPGR